MYDLGIIGAGPAGLAAANYALRKGLDAIVVSEELGGKANYDVRFPEIQEYHVIRAKEQVASFRGTLEYIDHLYRLGRVVRVRPLETGVALHVIPGASNEEEVLECRKILVATGTRVSRYNVPGERELLGRGLGYSSISYSHALHDRSVFLAGNSDRVLQSALEMSLQAEHVTLLLEPQSSYSKKHFAVIENQENISILNGYHVDAFEGDQFCEQVRVQHMDKPAKIISADAFFLEREVQPNSEIVRELLTLDSSGRISVDAHCRTSHPSIFAAGDVTTVGIEQILVAIGEGVKAVLTAYREIMME
ncbi:MAG: NAD(P)/FAD-dependent oxidoreductase [Alkalispirochaetaceae bacterium]